MVYSSPTLSNTIVVSNTRGGGLYVYKGTEQHAKPVVTYCDFYGNSGGEYANFSDETGRNGNISIDPLFADVANGDFHLRSRGGRWDPLTKAWVADSMHSPCIDAGDPKSEFGEEPSPNGRRVNMGADGNTAEASKSAP